MITYLIQTNKNLLGNINTYVLKILYHLKVTRNEKLVYTYKLHVHFFNKKICQRNYSKQNQLTFQVDVKNFIYVVLILFVLNFKKWICYFSHHFFVIMIIYFKPN